MNSLELTQADNYTEAFRIIYTDADLMKAWITGARTVADRLRRAVDCLTVARNPRYRFGLNSSDTVVVIPMCEAVVKALLDHVQPLVAELKTYRLEGHGWNASFHFLDDDLGFDCRDLNLLAASHFGMDPELTAFLADD